VTTITLGFLDTATGALTLDAEQPLAAPARQDLAALGLASSEMGCANPTTELKFDSPAQTDDTIRVSGYWHNSLWEGPGRRSVVRVQGCPIQCNGCWVRETWSTSAGQVVDIATVADALLSSNATRDGVTIVGGEPFAQPKALAALVDALRERQPDLHITVYSGYTLGKLATQDNPYVDHVLDGIDILIDGPYVEALSDTAGPWTGSGNQKVRYMRGE